MHIVGLQEVNGCILYPKNLCTNPMDLDEQAAAWNAVTAQAAMGLQQMEGLQLAGTPAMTVGASHKANHPCAI